MLKTKQPQAQSPPKLKKPEGSIPVPKFVIARQTPSGELEYLYDQWKAKVSFSADPVAAKATGFSWMYEADAVFIKNRIEKELNLMGLGIVSIIFKREKDGTWSHSEAR